MAGATNPAFVVDASTASQATGVKVKGAAAGAGVAVSAISSGSNEALTLDAKGTGIVNLASVSTGAVVFGQGEGGTPAVQTIRAPAAVGTNIAGANLTIAGSQSTGTGLGGSLIFQVSNLAGSGAAVNAFGTVLTLAPPNTGTTAVVNGLTVTGAITTGNVTLAATGTDANITTLLDAKGTGQVRIGSVSTGLVSIGRGSASSVIQSGAKASIGAGNQTATAAQLLGGYITGAQNGNTVTLDIATNIDTAIPGAVAGDSFTCVYVNTGAGNGTITTAAGLTLFGTLVVPTLKNALLIFRKTGVGTYDVITIVTS